MKGKTLTEGFTRIRAPKVEPRACSILVNPMTGGFLHGGKTAAAF
jgi:hypothetical protein